MNKKKWAREHPMTRDAGESLIMGRLLVLQSKRLMLNSLQRRLDEHGSDALKERVERLRVDVEMAQSSYRSTMLSWGSAETHGYWLVAYGRLIEVGNVVAARLRAAADDLPPAERYQVSAEVEMLEHMVANWTEAMRKAMIRAVA